MWILLESKRADLLIPISIKKIVTEINKGQNVNRYFLGFEKKLATYIKVKTMAM